MSAPLKVFALPFAVIEAILERADIPAQARDVESGQDSPVSRPRQLLPPSIIAALAGHLIEDRQMVALPAAEAAILSGWLRELAAQAGVAESDRTRFRDAADTIQQAKP